MTFSEPLRLRGKFFRIAVVNAEQLLDGNDRLGLVTASPVGPWQAKDGRGRKMLKELEEQLANFIDGLAPTGHLHQFGYRGPEVGIDCVIGQFLLLVQTPADEQSSRRGSSPVIVAFEQPLCTTAPLRHLPLIR